MTVEKDTGTTTENAIMEVKDVDTLAKKENTKTAKAQKAVKLAVSKYIEELLEKEGSLAEIGNKLYAIDCEIQKNKANINSSFERSLGNWHRKEREPSLYNLCLLTQVHHDSYDYILGLDKTIGANQLTYGYTLAFFSHLFRAGKIKVFRCKHKDLFVPASTVASKGYFDMTRFLKFTDKTLCDIFQELNQQKLTDIQIKDEGRSGYKMALQQFISKYENTLLVSETCGNDTGRYVPQPSNNGQNKPSQEIYHGIPDNLLERIKSLPKKYGKNQKKFAEDAGIPQSTFSEWVRGERGLSSSGLYLMAKTYGFSVDSFLGTGASDKNNKKHPCEYTYGNTLRFIDQLQAARVIQAVPNLKYFTPSTNNTHYHTKNPDGKNPNNMNYSRDGEPAYLPGLFFIRDDFLIRLITETEAEMSRPFDAPQSPDTAQISYEMSLQRVNKLIARYDCEKLLYYQGKVGAALMRHSEKRREYCYGHDKSFTALLDMSIGLDEMLEELRAVEMEASEALQNENAIKQKM